MTIGHAYAGPVPELLAAPDLEESVRLHFEAVFTSHPTRLGTAPGRLNLIGEHTDYNAGLCLPMALPHRTAVAANLRDDELVRLHSRQSEQTWQGRLDEISPGSVPGWAAYVVGTMWMLRGAGLPVGGADLMVDSAVPVGAGLSSSAALECATAAAVLDLDDVDPDVLIEACMRAETEFAGAPTGGMDQTISIRGRADHALLIDFGRHEHRHVACAPDQDGLTFLVVDTRVSHSLNDGGYGSRRADTEAAAAQLGAPLGHLGIERLDELEDPRLHRRARHIFTENTRVERAAVAMAAGDWPAFGQLMSQSHASMRDDYEISCAELDRVVDVALDNGALGARMTGGGFGGSAIALVESKAVAPSVAAIESAFAEAGWRTPDWLVATPSDGARSRSI